MSKIGKQQKKPKKPKSKTPPPAEYDGSTPLSSAQQEFFCVLFTTNTLPFFWGHGQHSYSFAYGHDDRVEKIQDEIDELNLRTKKGREKSKELHKAIESIHRSCRAAAPRLLASVSVKLRCGYLMDQLASHLIVDRELLYTIQQRDDLEVKMRAIEHHDKRVGRIREKVDTKREFTAIDSIVFVTPE